MKSSTDLTSNTAVCKLFPAGPQTQLYLAATAPQIQWLQTYLKQGATFVPRNLGIGIKTITLPRPFPSYHQETSNEDPKDNELNDMAKLRNCFTICDPVLKIWAWLRDLIYKEVLKCVPDICSNKQKIPCGLLKKKKKSMILLISFV